MNESLSYRSWLLRVDKDPNHTSTSIQEWNGPPWALILIQLKIKGKKFVVASIKVFEKTELKILSLKSLSKNVVSHNKRKVILNWLDLQRGDTNSSVEITPIFFKSRCKFYFTISYFMISLLLFLPTRTWQLTFTLSYLHRIVFVHFVCK